MRIGFACLTLSVGAGWVLRVSLPFDDDRLALFLDSAGGTPTLLVYLAAGLGAILLVCGLVCQILRNHSEEKRLTRRRVIVIEVRGLRDTSGNSLTEAVSPMAKGMRESLLVDLRQGIHDGEIVAPEIALQKLRSLPDQLRQSEAGRDRNDVSVIYGGLSPVPLTFFTGICMDDEMAISTYDWDRHRERWRALDGEDDGRRFRLVGSKDVPQGAKEVALAVSVSYAIRVDDIQKKLGQIPVVTLDLDEGGIDCHWSEQKQRELGEQFLATVQCLARHGVHRIHLFLAAQNSVTFRFGRLYDRRNLPEVVVYQYDRRFPEVYPWGVLMPVGGIGEAQVVRE